MTKKFSVLQRTAALLAALCLLAGLALPVCAEGAADALSVQNVETMQQGNDPTAEILPDEQTDEDKTAPDGAAAATPTPTPTATPTATPTPTPTATPAATPTPTPTAASTATPTPVPTATPTATPTPKPTPTVTPIPDDEENGESKEKFVTFAAVNAVAESGATHPKGNYTIYFVPPTYWTEGENENVEIYFRGLRGANNNGEYKAAMTKSGEITKIGERPIYEIELSYADSSESCPYGGYVWVQFQVGSDDNSPPHWIKIRTTDNKSSSWLFVDEMGGKCFEGDKYTDKTVTTDEKAVSKLADYNNIVKKHVLYGDQKIYFQNKTESALTNITVTFYEKDGDKYNVVGKPQTIESLAEGKVSDAITIPSDPCAYVSFTDASGSHIGKMYYNFYKDDVDSDEVGTFQYNAKTNDCFIYNGQSDVQWGAPNATRIYFDATFSDMSYSGDSATADGMPGNDGKLYYILTRDDKTDTLSGEMTRLEDRSESRHLWYVNVPEGYTKVQFSDTATPPTSSDINGRATDTLTWGNLKEPCFYADTGDDITYGGDYRDGYWGEKSDIRDAEAGKGADAEIVKLDTGIFTPQNNVKYIDSTLYDYYSDYELNGNNRANYSYQNTQKHRSYVEFEQFDRALSDYYKDYEASTTSTTKKKVQYPLYTGHFQPDGIDNDWFSKIAANLDLYGWGGNLYNTFMAVNNANVDVDGNTNNNHSIDSSTFQGLVSDRRDGNHNPTLYGTDLAEPHFNEKFLTGENSAKAVLGKVYKDVAFPFKQKNVFDGTNNDNKESVAQYWYYDSNETPLYLKKDTNEKDSYYLDSFNGDAEKEHSRNRNTVNGEEDGYGFFPFNQYAGNHVNQYNYGYGAKLQFDFTLTDNGRIVVSYNNGEEQTVPIKFFFSGDDDVWVFIDDKLVLDVGGAHAKAQGLLEFGADGENNTVTSYVSNIKASNNKDSNNEDSNKLYYESLDGNTKNVTFNKKNYTFNWQSKEPITLTKNTKHTLTMYYMERGMWESNMAVAFNFPDHNELQVEKQVDATGVRNSLKSYFADSTLQFKVGIKNWATHYAALNPTATTDAGGGSGIGFTTKQYTIKDYGSVEAKGLVNADGAQYTTSKDEKTYTVGKDGTFTLQNGETVTFADQFRRGSYISLQEDLQEDADKKLYAPTWEIYENGKLVKESKGDTTVEVPGDVQIMKGDGTTPDDGRKEKYKDGNDEDGKQINNTGYTKNEKPDEKSIVFRSYSNPAGTDQFTKLKVKFINKVKTGSLSITKQVPEDEQATLGDKTYTFTVQYSNIGGMHLEGNTEVTETVDVKVGIPVTLDKIPIGTKVTITEETPKNQYIKSITVNGKSVDGKEASDTIVADTTGKDGKTIPSVQVVFTNTAHKPITIAVEKTWKNAKGDLPASIWIKLQRRHADSTNDWEDVQGTEVALTKDDDTGKWTHTFTGMDAYDISGPTYYAYRVVESDAEDGKYTADGTLKLGDYKYKVGSETRTITADDNKVSLTLTNTQVPPVYELAITKQGLDENGKKTELLKGVVFKLEKLNNNGVDATFGAVTGTTESVGDNAGKCRFTNLSEGSYRLTELKTVDGYNLLAAPIEFTLQNGQCLINRMPQDGMVTGNPAKGYTVSLIINNRKGFTLPHTGADAPSLWLLIGLPLLVAGLLVLVFRYNRKGGKRS